MQIVIAKLIIVGYIVSSVWQMYRMLAYVLSFDYTACICCIFNLVGEIFFFLNYTWARLHINLMRYAF